MEQLELKGKLPISLPENLILSITRLTELKTITNPDILCLALVHSSYLNEHILDFDKSGIKNAVIFGLLESLGSEYVILALNDIGFNNPHCKNPHDVDEFVALEKKEIFSLISDYFNLTEYVYLGKGESNNQFSRHVKESISRQFIGALRICSNYETVNLLLKDIVEKHRMSVSPVSSFKSELQEYTQSFDLGTPKYELLDESGPDHEKTFRIKVSTSNGHYAIGEGPRKKSAEEVAAHLYTEKYAKEWLKNHYKPSAVSPHNNNGIIAEKHKQAIKSLCLQLRIPDNFAWLVSRALIHSSYINETRELNIVDNNMMAQLGAYVLNAIVYDRVYDDSVRYPISKINFVPIASINGNLALPEINSIGFDELRLGNFILMSRGQQSVGLNSSIKANAFQAIIAAKFLISKNIEGIENFLPTKIIKSIDELIVIALKDPNNTLDSKTKLQEQLQALGLVWQYDNQEQGPEHEKLYQAKINITSNQINKSITLKNNKTGVSFTEAEKAVAFSVSYLIDSINANTLELSRFSKSSADKFRSSWIFFIEHEFANAPSTYIDIRRWRKYGFLGTSLLQKSDSRNFIIWCNTVESIFGNQKGEIPGQINVLPLFKGLRNETKDKVDALFNGTISEIERFLDNLTLEIPSRISGRFSPFKQALSLSSTFKLFSQEYKSVLVSDLLDELALLRKNRPPKLVINTDIPDKVIWCRDGIIQMIINEVLDLLNEPDCLQSDSVVISISIDFSTS